MKKEMKKSPKNDNQSSSDSNNNENNRAYVKEFEMKVGLDQTYGPPTVEDYKVVQFVTYVFYEMYPMKDGEVYPSAWKEGVVYGYQKIREARAKQRKSATKDGMKGLRLHIIVGALLYCTLVQSKEALMPVPIFLQYLNNALKRYLTKNDRKEIDIKTFERYRTESKLKGIGIKPYISKVLPLCYRDLEPEDMVQFTGFSKLKLKRPEVFRARRIADKSKGYFNDTEPPSYIAIASLYMVGIQNGLNVNGKFFGITDYKLKQSVKTILKAAEVSTKLATNVQNFDLPKTPKKKNSSIK